MTLYALYLQAIYPVIIGPVYAGGALYLGFRVAQM